MGLRLCRICALIFRFSLSCSLSALRLHSSCIFVALFIIVGDVYGGSHAQALQRGGIVYKSVTLFMTVAVPWGLALPFRWKLISPRDAMDVVVVLGGGLLLYANIITLWVTRYVFSLVVPFVTAHNHSCCVDVCVLVGCPTLLTPSLQLGFLLHAFHVRWSFGALHICFRSFSPDYCH